jgi:hypothetical protein
MMPESLVFLGICRMLAIGYDVLSSETDVRRYTPKLGEGTCVSRYILTCNERTTAKAVDSDGGIFRRVRSEDLREYRAEKKVKGLWSYWL